MEHEKRRHIAAELRGTAGRCTAICKEFAENTGDDADYLDEHLAMMIGVRADELRVIARQIRAQLYDSMLRRLKRGGTNPWRELSREEEKEFRSWARKNYVRGERIDVGWHPVVKEECRKINAGE